MWLLERRSSDFAEVFIVSAPFSVDAEKSDGVCNTLPWHCSLPGNRISTDFGRKFPFFLLRTLVSFVAIRQQQTQTHSYLLAH